MSAQPTLSSHLSFPPFALLPATLHTTTQSVGQTLPQHKAGDSSSQQPQDAAAAAVGGAAGVCLQPHVAITNSFGMPSMDRAFLMKDIPAAKAALGPGQVRGATWEDGRGTPGGGCRTAADSHRPAHTPEWPSV